jgi:exopolysaccharide production protein ExoQ
MKTTVSLKNRFLAGALLALAVLLALWRSFTPSIVRIRETAFDVNATIEVCLWCLVVIGLGYSVWYVQLFHAMLLRMRKNWLLIIFLALASISITWSIAPVISIYRLIALLASACVGIYLGSTKDENKLLDVLFWAGVIIVMLSFTLAIMFPFIGRMFFPPYNGAWRGLFWHKNELGSIMSFFAFIYLFRALRNIKVNIAILDFIFYILSVGLVYLSRSVAGYITLIFLHIAVVIVIIWLRIQTKLHRLHYFLIGIGAGIIALLFYFNLDRLFGLFNRSSDLTGRVQLWQYLLRDVVKQNPVFGHGFGALWYLDSFRTQVQKVVGWTYQVVIGDNGFMDILLHLGWVGLSIFSLLFFVMFYRAIRYALSYRTFVSFLPLLILLYSLIGNVSFSLFFETETFVWICMIAALFLATDDTRNPQTPAMHNVT